MSSSLLQHYQQRFTQFGATHEAVHWSSRDSQFARFAILSEPISTGQSVLDVGCGLGDMLQHLREDRAHQGQYLGLDIVPEFIEHCRNQYAQDQSAQFQLADAEAAELPKGYDWCVLSGVFNNQQDDNLGFIHNTLEKMYKACQRGVAINALSTYVDYQDAGLYYTDPLGLVDYCKRNICPRVTLRHDYLVKANSIPFEFSLYLWKE